MCGYFITGVKMLLRAPSDDNQQKQGRLNKIRDVTEVLSKLQKIMKKLRVSQGMYCEDIHFNSFLILSPPFNVDPHPASKKRLESICIVFTRNPIRKLLFFYSPLAHLEIYSQLLRANSCCITTTATRLDMIGAG